MKEGGDKKPLVTQGQRGLEHTVGKEREKAGRSERERESMERERGSVRREQQRSSSFYPDTPTLVRVTFWRAYHICKLILTYST